MIDMRKKVVGALLTGMFILSACTFSDTKEIDQSLQRSSSGFDTDNTNETAPEMVTTEIHEEKPSEEKIAFEAEQVSDDFESIKSAMIDFITNCTEKGAINDIDFSSEDFESFPEIGEVVTFNEVNELYEEMFICEDIQCFYSFMYEECERPVMAIIVTDNPNYYIENNVMFFLIYNAGQLHLTSVINTYEQARSDNYLGKNGVYSSKEYANSRITVAKTEVITQKGTEDIIFDELILFGNELSYPDEYSSLYNECYTDKEPNLAIGKVEFDGQIHYCLYEFGERSDADKQFIIGCEEQGFVFESREEIMKMIENFASDKGYDIKLDELDAQRVEWVKV
ncbi:hypothetical protein SAMN02910398_01327 [Butyrivibrio sp. YAB3001]|nr:hypothetical protein SAMN02910398_01327 [Butyrivibrio sp. YAB3001]